LTVEWKPDSELNASKRNRKDPDFVADIVYGTNTSDGEQNYLVFGKVRIPNQEYLQAKYKESKV
jgi:hypothetical protein